VKKLDFIYFDAGGGHRAAATALKQVCELERRPWDVRMVNLQEVLDPLDVFRKVTGIRLEDIYNKMLAKGWTLGSAQGLKFMHAVIRLYRKPAVELLAKFWAESKPDMVVSLVPNLNRAMFDGLRQALPKVPYVTILTDLADYPPHFWMERQEQYFICGSEKAMAQARALGHPDSRVYRASGMILRPAFYQPVTTDRVEGLRRLNLDPAKPTGLVLFGGQGSRVMLEIAASLRDRQLILICGRNERLAAQLRASSQGAPHFVEGFTAEIPYYMHLSDFFIGKPGPGSISEAIHMGLPVIVERNAWTLPQERYNADWVTENGVGIVLPNFRGIADACSQLDSRLEEYRQAARRIRNRAIYEIPSILEEILERAC
jgi:1,2-diacylglycerol 3-beta-galactosyltransferase